MIIFPRLGLMWHSTCWGRCLSVVRSVLLSDDTWTCICLLAVCSENVVVSCCSPRSLQIPDTPVLEVCVCRASLGFGCFAIIMVQCPMGKDERCIFHPSALKHRPGLWRLRRNLGGSGKVTVLFRCLSKAQGVVGGVCVVVNWAPVWHLVWILEVVRKIWDGVAALSFTESSCFVSV